jgi:hypothetical protein
MDQRSEGQEVQRPSLTDIQTMFHNNVVATGCAEAARFVASKDMTGITLHEDQAKSDMRIISRPIDGSSRP